MTDEHHTEVAALRAELARVTLERDTAQALLKEYRDEYTHTPRCMKEATGPCTCGYDGSKA